MIIMPHSWPSHRCSSQARQTSGTPQAGLGPRSGQGVLVAAWYAGLTVLALAPGGCRQADGLPAPTVAAATRGHLTTDSAGMAGRTMETSRLSAGRIQKSVRGGT